MMGGSSGRSRPAESRSSGTAWRERPLALYRAAMASGTRPGRGATLGRRRGGDLHLAAAQPRHWMRKPLHQRFVVRGRSEEHTSELQSLMRISYAVFCLKKKNTKNK